MKKIIFLLILSIPFFSCSNNDNGTSDASANEQLSSSPEALEEYDDSSYGIYKGIFVGSTGTVYINIYNGGSISAKMVIEGVTYNFKTSETAYDGKAITSLTFFNTSSSFDFNVQADGEYPTITNLNIKGHPKALVQLLKEYSFEHIKCYVGTFDNDENSIFNLATTSNGYILGLALQKGETEIIYMDGTFEGTKINGTFEGGHFSGTINNNKLSGIWEDSMHKRGNWTATRKL
ncbi:hypothetical protein FLJC2902T_07870 [Flavobacterium limnosediminis JC2902]|uniref:Lipoprotein n=1 Tax=Flavobacterium limnosediminis JC2902 TaxID=1341181 RepID=V6SRQ9_9FLAO|nr:hypothetical protein [Flavobacterium limnosediminis]ESU29388.1 hypothetical protein FLJC2902T_07870 [Flavobacterium limnosediminis JC2902]